MSECMAYEQSGVAYRKHWYMPPLNEWWRCNEQAVYPSRYCAAHEKRLEGAAITPAWGWDVPREWLLIGATMSNRNVH